MKLSEFQKLHGFDDEFIERLRSIKRVFPKARIISVKNLNKSTVCSIMLKNKDGGKKNVRRR